MNKLAVEKFNTLPQEVQLFVKSQLKAYDEVTVSYENGRYSYGVCIKAEYAPDHEVLGTIKATDIYSDVERIENYINSFCTYPIDYKGKRDYSILKKMQNEKEFDWDKNTCTRYTGKIINGNFELTGKETSNMNS